METDPGPPDPAPLPVAVLEELLVSRGERLLHAAVLLAGSHHDGEDLLQAALERVYRHWQRIDGDPEGYRFPRLRRLRELREAETESPMPQLQPQPQPGRIS